MLAHGRAVVQRSRARGQQLQLARESVSRDLLSQCSLNWFTTDLDHFSRTKGPNGKESFKLRYYVCDEHHSKGTKTSPPGPIFFYLGNESNVQLYLNATGLMWENAEDFGAMLIFAEHRYYGESLPFGPVETYKHMQWLSTEQAMADYASLLYSFKEEHSLRDAPVVGFGGSYGGMLATWARQKYPHVWAGAIAGSAPIWTFMGEQPPMDPLFYSKTVTYDTSVAAGAAPGCTSALRSAFAVLTAQLSSASHRPADTADTAPHGTGTLSLADISNAMSLCPGVMNNTEDAAGLRDWAAAAFDMMAMGSYPYASSYMLNGNGELPPFPMRVACDAMMTALSAPEHDVLGAEQLRGDLREAESGQRLGDDSPLTAGWPEAALLEGLAAAAGVWYNYSGDVECYNPFAGVNEETDKDGDLWDYQYCTEMFMPFAKSGQADIYWNEPWNETQARQDCMSTWGVQPRATWGTIEWGGRDLRTLTNVVFSNGLMDPWHGGGVMKDLSKTVKSVIIPEGGHHLDLMFSNPEDPPSVTAARKAELRNIRRWIREFHHARRVFHSGTDV